METIVFFGFMEPVVKELTFNLRSKGLYLSDAELQYYQVP